MQSPFAKTQKQWINKLSSSHPVDTESFNFQDPILNQGGELIYDQEHDFIIRMQQTPNQVQTLKNTQKLNVKIIVTQLHGACKNIKIQLTSDSQLYFNFIFNCSDWEFKRIKQNQNMFIDFKQYPQVIMRGFRRLKNHLQQSKFLAVFSVFTEKQGKLDIIRKAEFRDDTILEFDFFKSSEQSVKQSIQFRYELLRQQYALFSSRYEGLTEAIKSKNPSLMMQIQKTFKKGK